MDNNPVEISIVVPVFNSADVIDEFFLRIQKAMHGTGISYELILTDDRSSDQSWQRITAICQVHKEVIGMRLTKNCGQWFATLAGISVSKGRYILTIDDDLEYDPADIPGLYHAIGDRSLSVIFGIAKDKYLRQNKNLVLYRLMNIFLNAIWNNQPRISFKILDRAIVFSKSIFLVKEPLDAFITHNVKSNFWSTYSVQSNKRYAGHSNYSALKKSRLFFLYSSYIVIHPISKMIIAFLLFCLSSYGYYFFSRGTHNVLILSAFAGALLLLAAAFLYFLFAALSRPKHLPIFSIAESINIAPSH